MLNPGQRVLEPGAGNGEFTQRIAGSGASVAALEISPRQAALASERLASHQNVKVLVGDVDDIAFPDQEFDSVVGSSVLHHLDLSRALPEMLRVLKPGGRFFFFEPNMLNPQVVVERKIRFVGRRLDNSPDETAFFRWKIAGALRRAGFRSVDVRPWDFVHPATPVLLLSVVDGLSKVLSWMPLIREIAGSLQIYAER
jgi:ubiquinone/menaquinone biosynthesis C-methylase UbiE